MNETPSFMLPVPSIVPPAAPARRRPGHAAPSRELHCDSDDIDATGRLLAVFGRKTIRAAMAEAAGKPCLRCAAVASVGDGAGPIRVRLIENRNGAVLAFYRLCADCLRSKAAGVVDEIRPDRLDRVVAFVNEERQR